jgi:hypothetical protein
MSWGINNKYRRNSSRHPAAGIQAHPENITCFFYINKNLNNGHIFYCGVNIRWPVAS